MLLVLLAACNGTDKPSATAQEERVAHAYAELTLLSESSRLGMPSDTTRSYQDQADSILLRYDMDRQAFESDFRRFSDDPERSALLFRMSREHLQAIRARRDSSARTP